MTTVAARKVLEGKAAAVTLNEACGFWDISARSNANTLNVRLAELSALLARAKQALDQPMDADGFAIQSGKLNLKQIEIMWSTSFGSSGTILERIEDHSLAER